MKLDPNDIEVFRPLIAFNDHYSHMRTANYNKLREKMNLPLFKDYSKIFTEEDKAKLILQGLLGSIRGDLIRDKAVIRGRVVTTGHSYNIETDNVIKKHHLLYSENYYGSYNTPTISTKNVGLSDGLLATRMFKTVLGEKDAFKKHQFYQGGKDTSDNWGHLLNAVTAGNVGVYGTVIALITKTKGYNKEYQNDYDVTINDMTFKASPK
ncbi:hypothetical protein [Mycoplasmoides gallisepticum]|uniref:hypothetical protein n=1 Tax=Mycoplasmoides gallisepticum TaxID=2096 RepID=UPI000B0E47F6|nr:hypothetical protein [Mycoplasmoides gallisepticum]